MKTDPIFDEKGFMARVAGNTELALEVMDCFFEENLDIPDIFLSEDGFRDIDKAAFLAHRLGSGASHVGALRLAGTARKVEIFLVNGYPAEAKKIADCLNPEMKSFKEAVRIWTKALQKSQRPDPSPGSKFLR